MTKHEFDAAYNEGYKNGYEAGRNEACCDDAISRKGAIECMLKQYEYQQKLFSYLDGVAKEAIEQEFSDDGTLTVNVEDGNKVSRVLVCGDNHFGGLYYPEQEPQTGHWIEHERNGILHIECSECLSWFLRAHLLRNSYCPNCGADMRGERV